MVNRPPLKALEPGYNVLSLGFSGDKKIAISDQQRQYRGYANAGESHICGVAQHGESVHVQSMIQVGVICIVIVVMGQMDEIKTVPDRRNTGL